MIKDQAKLSPEKFKNQEIKLSNKRKYKKKNKNR